MDNLWIEALNEVKDLASNPEVFLEPKKCETHFNNSKSITKVLYDATKLIENEAKTDNDKTIGKWSDLSLGGFSKKFGTT